MFRRIATYSASIYAATLVTSAASFVVTMVIARRIPKEALGQYGYYVTIYAFLGLVLCSGVNQALVKFLGDRREDRRQLLRFVVGLFFLLGALSWPTAALFARVGSIPTAWGLAALPFSILYLLAGSYFRTDFHKRGELTLRIAVSLLNSSLTFALAFLSADPRSAPIHGDFLSMAIPGVVLLVLFLHRAQVRSPRALLAALPARRLLAFALPLTVAGMAFHLYANAATLLIRGIVGLAALGEYYFALQLMGILEKPMGILATVILAAFSRDPGIGPDGHRRLVTFNLAVFPLLAAAIAWGAPLGLSLADRLLHRVGGEPLAVKFALAPAFVSLFALAVPARCVEFLVSSLCIARGWPQVNRNVHLWTALLAIPLLTLLVVRFGPWGAAVMPILYQTIFLTLQAVQLRSRMPEIIASTSRAALVGTVAMGALLLVGRALPNPWLFPLGAAGYLLLGQLLGGWDLRLLLPRPGPVPAPVESG